MKKMTKIVGEHKDKLLDEENDKIVGASSKRQKIILTLDPVRQGVRDRKPSSILSSSDFFTDVCKVLNKSPLIRILHILNFMKRLFLITIMSFGYRLCKMKFFQCIKMEFGLLLICQNLSSR